MSVNLVKNPFPIQRNRKPYWKANFSPWKKSQLVPRLESQQGFRVGEKAKKGVSPIVNREKSWGLGRGKLHMLNREIMAAHPGFHCLDT
ncbi:MAG: hypothetical protein K1Y36_27635 [Blastocatellia bacterium]|nr:hypothetical protein [Blastocatellia bacterium]